jgi:hypothetical protein
MEGVGKSGLVLSKGKTLVSPRFFSLNSTPFRGFENRVKMIPFVRAKALYTKPDNPSAWAGQISSVCPGFRGRHASVWRVRFLRAHSSQVWISQRSITRGLGVHASRADLRLSGLWRRERFYLRFSSEEPLRALASGCATSAFPKGFQSWSRSTAGVTRETWRVMRAAQDGFHLACRLHAQSSLEAPSKGSWLEQIQRGTCSFSERPLSFRLGISSVLSAHGLAPAKEVGYRPRQVEMLMWPARRIGRFAGVGLGHGPAAVDEA